MKINYNGQGLEAITEGYWPEGVTLVCEKNNLFKIFADVVCMRNSRVMLKNGDSYGDKLAFSYWAILPPKPATRRLTNREVLALCRKGWDVCVCGTVSSTPEYSIHDEDEEAEDTSLRAPGHDEWVEPTSELLEVEK